MTTVTERAQRVVGEVRATDADFEGARHGAAVGPATHQQALRGSGGPFLARGADRPSAEAKRRPAARQVGVYP